MLPKVKSVKALPNYLLEVEFDDGVLKSFSVVPYLDYTVYKPLKITSFFKTVTVKYNTVIWGKEEEIDFDPYTIYTEGVTLHV
jgi:Protein of unknown function (DUF2442)